MCKELIESTFSFHSFSAVRKGGVTKSSGRDKDLPILVRWELLIKMDCFLNELVGVKVLSVY